jgi:hypothetical protein
MDVQTIDQQYEQLQTQAQQTIQELRDLAGKLSTAAQGGNQDAKEWLLDLKSVALAIQAEQNQVGFLLQALHGFVANQGQALTQQPAQPGPWGSAPQGMSQAGMSQGGSYSGGYGGMPMGGGMGGGVGGMLGSFLNSGFGRALEMGAGFGIGNDLINKIF